jgi:hypothetical protein
VTDLSKLHSAVWPTLSADEKADALRWALLGQEVLIRALAGSLNIRFVTQADDDEDVGDE